MFQMEIKTLRCNNSKKSTNVCAVQWRWRRWRRDLLIERIERLWNAARLAICGNVLLGVSSFRNTTSSMPFRAIHFRCVLM